MQGRSGQPLENQHSHNPAEPPSAVSQALLSPAASISAHFLLLQRRGIGNADTSSSPGSSSAAGLQSRSCAVIRPSSVAFEAPPSPPPFFSSSQPSDGVGKSQVVSLSGIPAGRLRATAVLGSCVSRFLSPLAYAIRPLNFTSQFFLVNSPRGVGWGGVGGWTGCCNSPPHQQQTKV